ncbi:hypothetical protein [Hymenobacter antarcticus]
MKKFLFLFVACGATVSAGFAQAPAPTVQTVPPAGGMQQSPEQMVTRRTQYLAKELGLSADQQARLQPLLLTQRQQMQVLREQRTTGGRRQGTAQDLKAAQAKFDEQLKAVFTPEQYAKFNAMKDGQRDKVRERRAAGAGQPE